MFRKTLVAIAAAAFSTTAFAGDLTVSTDPGLQHVTPGIFDFSVKGNQMVGMEVTAYFIDGGMETATWAAGLGMSGGAMGTGWGVGLIGDTFTDAWAIGNRSDRGIRKIVFNGTPGDTVFDIQNVGEGTPGSATGLIFEVESSPRALDIEATYKNEVAIEGEAPVGDLFTELELLFTNRNGMRNNRVLMYKADTDLADVTAIPLPAAAWAGMTMLGGLGISRRVRRA